MKAIIKFIILLSAIIFTSINSLCSAYQCCAFNKMDSDGVVLVEAGRILPAGRYQAVKFRSCSNQLVAVQLWNCDPETLNCRFRWQTLAQTASVDQSVNFASITIGNSDRLAVFTTANSSSQFPIPFGQDILAYLYRSTSQFSDAYGFSASSQITLNKVAMSRSFAGSVVFCENRDCLNLPTDALAPPTLVRDNVKQPALGQCCQSQAGCDPSSLGGQIAVNNITIQQLNYQISILQELIITLTNQVQPPTGKCREDFVAGPWGLGVCYAVFYIPLPFSVAAFYCRDNYVANLVSIGSAVEEQFLAKYISGRGGSFWTSGMYQLSDETWYWYDKRSESLQYQGYTKWQNNAIPKPASKDEVCSNLLVENVNGSVIDYWVKANCNERRYFICQMAKTCN